jgi:proteasome lid subunit RPN8/RPN11
MTAPAEPVRPEAVAAPPGAPEGLAQLSERPLPAPVETWHLHGRVPVEGAPVVLMHQQAILQVAAHSQSDDSVELGGALLGRAYRHSGGVVIEVMAALPAVSGDHGPIHFTFSADSWSHLHRDKASHYPDLDIIGWFHTHPDLGVFYSSDDVVVHSAAFTQPWHVGLVVDPIREEAAYFGWLNGVLTPYEGFYELPERQPTPLTPWRVVRTAVWDTSYEPPSPSGNAPSHIFMPGGGGRYSFPGREFGLGLAALALLSILLLGAAVVLPLWQRTQLLQDTVLALAANQQSGPAGATCPDPRLRIIAPIAGSTVTGEVPLVGTAAVDAARRYQVDMRPLNGDSWTLVDQTNRDTALGKLAAWDTSALPAGPYELRLSAVDHNNIRLAGSSACVVAVMVAR